ncbi:MAG TPA: helix-hairpin-helix domain-containing protein, partial [Myxococcota bacterium]
VRVPIGEGGVYLAGIAKARTFAASSRPETPREERDVTSMVAPESELAMSPERLFLPGAKDPIPLRPHTADRFLVEQLRDEAHRFAITGHRGRRKRRTLRSILDDIPGVGPQKRTALLKELGSVDAIMAASLETIAKIVGKSLAARVKTALGDLAVDPPSPDSIDDPVDAAFDAIDPPPRD